MFLVKKIYSYSAPLTQELECINGIGELLEPYVGTIE